VREISEGDIELMYTMEIVSPKDLEFREPKVSKVPETLNASPL
jgi:hypothetical protein